MSAALQYAGTRAQEINNAISDLGLDRVGVLLSEGFCPLCNGRSGEPPAHWDLEEEEREASAVVNCVRCDLQWRSGPNPDNGMDWIEYSQHLNDMRLTMILNAPRDPEDDEDDEEWQYDEFEED